MARKSANADIGPIPHRVVNDTLNEITDFLLRHSLYVGQVQFFIGVEEAWAICLNWPSLYLVFLLAHAQMIP